MNNQQFRQNYQGGIGHKCFNEYERLSDVILAKYPKADFSIQVTEELVSIKCRQYPDYIRYRAEIVGRVSLPIKWTEKKD